MNEQLKKRLKSFGWRFGTYISIAALELIIQSASDFNMPPFIVTVLGLALAEVTKYYNSHYKK